jgi:transposase
MWLPQRLIFIDEFGTNLGMTRRYGWALSGERACGAVPTNPDPNVTLVMGLRLEGLVAPLAFKGAIDGPVFRHYVETQLCPQLRPGDIVYADQVGAHRAAGVSELIEARGAEFRLLPPYSPDFSPVENCGSKVKEALRAAQPRALDELYDAMGKALGSVTASDARGWFERVGYIRPRRRPIRLRPGARYYPRRPPPLDFARRRDPRGRRSQPSLKPEREPL